MKLTSIKQVGLVGILLGRKMTFGLLVTGASFVGLMTGHLGGVEFAAIVSTVSSVLFASHSYQQSQTPKN